MRSGHDRSTGRFSRFLPALWPAGVTGLEGIRSGRLILFALYGSAYIPVLYACQYKDRLYANSHIDGIYDIAYIVSMTVIIPQHARNPDQLGNALRRFRNAREWSQAHLASRAGIRQATVSQIESGYAATRIDTIARLLAALDLELVIAPRSKGSSQDIEDLF